LADLVNLLECLGMREISHEWFHLEQPFPDIRIMANIAEEIDTNAKILLSYEGHFFAYGSIPVSPYLVGNEFDVQRCEIPCNRISKICFDLLYGLKKIKY